MYHQNTVCLPECTIPGFVETLSFQHMVKHHVTEGTVPVPPNRPLRFAIVSYYLLWDYRSSGWGGGITCRRPKKSGKKNILRISPEPNSDLFLKIFFCTLPVKSRKTVNSIAHFLALRQREMNMNGSHPTMKNCEGSTGTVATGIERPGAEFSG